MQPNASEFPCRPIKILHLISSLDPGGAERQLAQLVLRGSRKVMDPVVVSLTTEGIFGGQLRSAGISVVALGMKRGRPSFSGVWRLVQLIRREAPDIVQSWMYHADLLALSGKMAGVPRIVWNIRCSDMDMGRYRPLSGLVLKLLAKLSRAPDSVIVNSSAGLRFHELLGYKPRRWRRIPNGIDLETYRPDLEARSWLRAALGVPESSLLIGLVARYDPMKDHETFLSAVEQVHASQPGARFIMCGHEVDPYNRVLMENVRRHGVEPVTFLLGQRGDIPRLMAGLDVLCSSSAFGEGFSNVLGEAMACGIPCVATNVGDSEEIIGPTGLVVPPRNPQALADAIKQLLAMDGPARRDLRLAARRRIQERFSLGEMVRQYEQEYQELLAGMA